MQKLDADRSGSVSYEELIVGLQHGERIAKLADTSTLSFLDFAAALAFVAQVCVRRRRRACPQLTPSALP